MSGKRIDNKRLETQLHPRNKHRDRYNFKQLIESFSELRPYVKVNKYGDESIDFFNSDAVKILNKALLKHYYNISWNIPKGYLTPPIPGRADYIHYLADLLGSYNNGKIPKGKSIQCLDIGVGANCIYPIIGISEYGWLFTGSETDTDSMEIAGNIIESNPFLAGKVELRLQNNANDIFNGIINKDEFIDITMCNPPFHASEEEAQTTSLRKLKNLKLKPINNPVRNFGGRSSELWCKGGEKKFILDMISQSKLFAGQCFWFTTLVSKESNLKDIYNALKDVNVFEVRTIPMGQGNKVSRIVAWTFLAEEQQKKWVKIKWC